MRFKPALALLLIGTALVYVPSLGASFVYEDFRDAANQLEFPGWSVFLAQTYESPLRSLTALLTHGNAWLFGIQPWSFHLGNVVLHLVNVGLLLGLLWRVLPWQGAVMGAAVFAVHPLQTEAVAYVSGRSDLVATSGILLAMHAASLGSRAGALCGVLLACLGKETAIVAWALVPLWAHWTRAAFPLRAWLIGGVLTAMAVGELVNFDWGMDATSWEAVLAFWRFLVMIPFPVGLSIEHDWPYWVAWAWPLLMALVVVTGLALSEGWLSEWTWAFGWLWSVIAFAPRLLIPVYEAPHERHFYVVMVGWAVCAGYWLSGRTFAQERIA